MRSTCPAHHIRLDLIILIMLGEKYKLRSSLVRSFIDPPTISVQIYFLAPCSQITEVSILPLINFNSQSGGSGGGVQTVSTRHVGHFWPIVPARVIVRMENLVE
jgi:hypothetical protein